ncbi:unnamed protein product, partial [marine sediment metagenome]
MKLGFSARKGVRLYHTLENWFLGATIALIVIVVAAEAVMRQTMRAMPMGLEELALVTAAWL